MRAVNLVPASAGRGGREAFHVPAYAILAVLAAALVLVTYYVLTSNTIADRQARVGTLQAQAAQANTLAASLNKYTQFEQLAQTRAATVRQIAATRFDWHARLADLSKVVPADTSLQSLYATVAPGTGSGGGPGTGNTSALRGAITAPAFEMTGCTKTQDDVARLMSRLRLIDGVTRVTLADTVKPSTGADAGASAPTGTSTTGGCGANAPSFDLVVFFAPLAGAATTATAAAATATGTSTTPATGTSTTPATGTSTTPTTGTSTTPSTGTTATTATPPAGTSTTATTGTR